MSPPVRSNNIAILRRTFPLQSYFDNTLANAALVQQGKASPIVGASLNDIERQVTGRLLGLHPTSETPVAVQPLYSAESASAQTFWLTPGQVVRPKPGGFSALKWGLPFGWLGGGVAQLVIADNEDAFLSWPQQKVEVLFHRIRLQITADVNPGAPATTSPNWPRRFPWPNAFATAKKIAQGGSPLVGVEPTRVVMRLRTTLANPAPMRMIWQQLDSFDLGADGVTLAGTDFTGQDVQWPSNGGLTSTPFPQIALDGGPAITMGGDSTVLTLLDVSGLAVLVNQFVDLCRYGRI